jgi:hypothetical protein
MERALSTRTRWESYHKTGLIIEPSSPRVSPPISLEAYNRDVTASSQQRIR